MQHSVPNLFTGAHVIVLVQTACAAGKTSCSISWPYCATGEPAPIIIAAFAALVPWIVLGVVVC